ncbi:hypothetical protein OGATHE_005210 [Ogataea polymorpha]|uniref:Uncharacterized protein n=1 Tax=Ogataea polymorpha TaxID=460523 RepID=A0A9P8NV45_9ASCO|nr:hypothetical protein OGATHE_005210 [Ogataea polymorpha]
MMLDIWNHAEIPNFYRFVHRGCRNDCWSCEDELTETSCDGVWGENVAWYMQSAGCFPVCLVESGTKGPSTLGEESVDDTSVSMDCCLFGDQTLIVPSQDEEQKIPLSTMFQ